MLPMDKVLSVMHYHHRSCMLLKKTGWRSAFFLSSFLHMKDHHSWGHINVTSIVSMKEISNL